MVHWFESLKSFGKSVSLLYLFCLLPTNRNLYKNQLITFIEDFDSTQDRDQNSQLSQVESCQYDSHLLVVFGPKTGCSYVLTFPNTTREGIRYVVGSFGSVIIAEISKLWVNADWHNESIFMQTQMGWSWLMYQYIWCTMMHHHNIVTKINKGYIRTIKWVARDDFLSQEIWHQIVQIVRVIKELIQQRVSFIFHLSSTNLISIGFSCPHFYGT